jgi:hypothetical protein
MNLENNDNIKIVVYKKGWNNFRSTDFAVQGGYDLHNQPLYIGRVQHEDSFAVGKVDCSILYNIISNSSKLAPNYM